MQHIFRLSPFALLLPHVRSATLRPPLLCFAYDFLYTNKNNTAREVNHNNATLEEEREQESARDREREGATHFLAGFLFIQINYDFYVCAKHVVSN